jgi:hypothetical protein
VIKLCWNDHGPPHFHTFYGDEQVLVDINALSVFAGRLSPRAVGLVMEWATLHRQELLDDWRRAQAQRPLERIEPLR